MIESHRDDEIKIGICIYLSYCCGISFSHVQVVHTHACICPSTIIQQKFIIEYMRKWFDFIKTIVIVRLV